MSTLFYLARVHRRGRRPKKVGKRALLLCVGFQTLARLLKSRNPDDMRQANAIIKTIVNEVST